MEIESIDSELPYFFACPRCKWASYEVLDTHCYCLSCDYSPEFTVEADVPDWAIKAVKRADKYYASRSKKAAQQKSHGGAV